jgi:hypothetical protein
MQPIEMKAKLIQGKVKGKEIVASHTDRDSLWGEAMLDASGRCQTIMRPGPEFSLAGGAVLFRQGALGRWDGLEAVQDLALVSRLGLYGVAHRTAMKARSMANRAGSGGSMACDNLRRPIRMRCLVRLMLPDRATRLLAWTTGWTV